MADEDVRSTLILEGDSSGADKATAKVNKELTALQKSADADSQAFKKLGAEIASSVGNRAAQSLKEAQRNTEGLRKETDAAIKAVERYDQAFKQVSDRVAVLGDVDAAIGTVASLTSNISPELAGGLTIGQDLFAVAEGIPRLGVGIKELGTRVAESGGFFGSAASAAQSLIPGLSGSASGLVAVAAAAAPIVAIAGGVALAIAAVTAALEEQRKVGQAAAQGLIESLTIEQQARYLAERQRFDELQQRIDAEREAASVQANTLNAVREEYDKLSHSSSAALREQFGSFTAGQAAIEELDDEMHRLVDEASASQERLKALTDVQAEYADEIETAKATTEQAATAEKDLSAERDRSLATIAALSQQQEELTAAYERQAAATIANRKLQDARADEDAGIAAKRAQEDLDRALAEQAAAHEANMLAIAKRGDDAILAAQQALVDKQAEAAQAIADVQSQYQKDALKAEREFNKQRERDQREYRKALARLEDEYNKSRFDSILNNDVLSFLENESQFKSDRGQLKQDRRDQRRDNREDFNDEQAERLAAAQERIAQIQAELDKFTAATQAKIAEIERQTQIELDLAQKAFDDKLAKDQSLRDIQNQRDAEDAALRARRQAEDRRREDEAAAAALRANLDKIETRKQSEIDALDTIGGKASEVRAAESVLLDGLLLKIQQANTALTKSQTVPVPSSSSGSTPYVPTPGSDKFYEDPIQGPAGQSGGGNFGAGLNSVSSAGAARGGMSIPAPNIIIQSAGTDGGRQLVYADDVKRAFVEYTAMLTSELGMQEGRRG